MRMRPGGLTMQRIRVLKSDGAMPVESVRSPKNGPIESLARLGRRRSIEASSLDHSRQKATEIGVYVRLGDFED